MRSEVCRFWARNTVTALVRKSAAGTTPAERSESSLQYRKEALAMCVSGLPQFFDSFCMFLLCHGA